MASGDTQRQNLKCRPKNPYILIRKLVQLMEHPMSKNATTRQLEMLNDFLNTSHYAYWLQDLPYIIRLYEFLTRNIESVREFKRPMECLLYFSAVPPMLTKASDKLAYARDFQEYFSTLGYIMLCVHDDDLKKLVLHAIKRLLIPKHPTGFCCVPLENTKEAIEKSKLAEMLAELLRVISNDLYPFLLNVMFLICEISTSACQKMLEKEAIEYLLQRLEPTWRERNFEIKPQNPSPKDTIPVLEDSCCILWKLLNAMDATKANVKNPTVFALWSLQYAFRWANVCPGQRINRNNLSALLLKFLITFPEMKFVESDLASDILSVAISATTCVCCARLQFLEDQTDFYFKKIIWACLHFYHKFRGTEVPKEEKQLVKVFDKSLFQEHSPNKNHMEQHCELNKIILKIMPKFLIRSLDTFVQLNGHIKIIKIIEGYLLKPYDIELLEASMYCLNEMLKSGSDIILPFGENGADVITTICSKILENKTLTSTHQKTLAHGFCILQIIFTAEHVTSEVINLCIRYLDRVIHPNENDPLIDVRVTVCAVHLLWECTLTTNLFREFLKNGGIYKMLDITETSTFPVKSLSLGILADSATRSSSVPYLITWRKRGKKLISMLMEIFRNKTEKECDSIQNTKLTEVKNDNMWLALCQGQRNTFQHDCILKSELLKSSRCKIHGILHALKSKFKKRVAKANEHYKLYNEKLNTDDALTMLFAENFLSLSMCESWMSVSKELQSAGITPVEADSDYLTEKVSRIHQWKIYLQYKIEEVIQKEAQFEHLNELQTYITLKEARLADALDGLRDLSYISKCTERMFQMRQKLMLSQDVETIRVKNSNFHRTMSDLLFTNTYNQHISIQSNIIYERKEEAYPITPVSSDSNESVESSTFGDNLTEPQLEC